ncbi:MAG: aldo/keto reductase [Bacteriovoracia bacterium]
MKMNLGKSEIQVSKVIMGLWQAGKRYWVGVKDREVIAAIKHAQDCGISTFDTAEEYGDGYSEQILGKAIESRNEVVLLTKVFSNHLKKEQVQAACEASLKNLKTDYIDLYQIHWPSGSWGSKIVPVAETLEAMTLLKEQGKIRAIGVSNFSLAQLKEATEFAQIDSIQPPYSLLWRNIEKEIVPFCIENKISILAYSPLAQGFLTGKFAASHQFEKGDNRVANKLFSSEVFSCVVEAVEKLKPIADRKKITLAQLALAWVFSHKNTAAIAGARNKKQSIENAEAMEVTLTKDEIQEIENATWPVASNFFDDAIPWYWNP